MGLGNQLREGNPMTPCPWPGCPHPVEWVYERDGIRAGMCWRHWRVVVREMR